MKFFTVTLYFFKKYKDHINFNLGMAYYRSNRIEEAVDYFQEVLKSDEFESFSDKTLLKLLKEEGADKFIEKFKKEIPEEEQYKIFECLKRGFQKLLKNLWE